MTDHQEQQKIIRAWTFYDWANSAYSLIITSAIFPAYYSAIVPEKIMFLGREMPRAVMASFAISFSFLLIAFLSPMLSSIADYMGNKKAFMRFFCYLGSAACIALFFFGKNAQGETNVWFGLICSMIASIGYCGSIVFYNAFLPEIADKDAQDQVSARGFAMGYIGSVLLMLLCFAGIAMNDAYQWGLGTLPVRTSFLAVGIWWAGFAQITFRHLPEKVKDNLMPTSNLFTSGYHELQKVWKSLAHLPGLRKFLLAFFFYNMGVQTVMLAATLYGKSELQIPTTNLIVAILIIQLVAIPGAFAISKISEKIGNFKTLIVCVVIWIMLCIGGYLLPKGGTNEFYTLAICVGFVMGGIQSLSRSTYSKLMPVTKDTTSYFSFYDVTEKIAIVIGMFSFAHITEITGSQRSSVLALITFFIIGLGFLFIALKKQKGLHT